MNKKLVLRLFAPMSLMALLLTQFNNCGNYADPAAQDATSSYTCTTANCVNTSATNLKLSPHLSPTGDFPVSQSITEFNIGGDCNEGGYPNNTIVWTLAPQAGSPVRDSTMPVACSGTGASKVCVSGNSKCINGRFLIYVNLAPLTSGDTQNRTGLLNNGVRAPYDLFIDMYGQLDASNTLDPSVKTRATVELKAL